MKYSTFNMPLAVEDLCEIGEDIRYCIYIHFSWIRYLNCLQMPAQDISSIAILAALGTIEIVFGLRKWRQSKYAMY